MVMLLFELVLETSSINFSSVSTSRVVARENFLLLLLMLLNFLNFVNNYV